MRSSMIISALAVALAVVVDVAPVAAADKKPTPPPAIEQSAGGHRASAYYRKAPQVRGFVQRRGGYSYNGSDVANTYGNSRTLWGGTNTYRAPGLDRQTNSGPFDHGFFFDSGIAPRGGNSPYMN